MRDGLRVGFEVRHACVRTGPKGNPSPFWLSKT